MTIKEAEAKLGIISILITKGKSNRPGDTITPTHVTIHNTQNDSHGADALAHAKYLNGADARRRSVSWHYSVDDKRVVKHLPVTEKGWHTGDPVVGNRKSIGIEICENEGIDQHRANDRAALLAALLCYRLRIPIANVVPHQFWTGKDCPHLILAAPGGWKGYHKVVAGYLKEITTSEEKEKGKK